MKKRVVFVLFIIIILAAGFWYLINNYSSISLFQFFPKVATSFATTTNSQVGTTSFLDNFSTKKVRILIVPGHEPDSGGTNFGKLYERDLAVTIGEDLQQILDSDSHYQSFITRDAQSWNPIFTDYFQNNWNQILAWEQSAKIDFLKSTSTISSLEEIHNNADVDDAMRLYGVNKWSNENNIDLMIHIHLNNYPGASKKIAGKYSGLVMYIPSATLQNNTISRPIAERIFNRLSLYNPISNLPVQSQGLEEDSSLIAMGAYNTSNVASMLIEYEYIYDPQIVNPQVRDIAFKDLAYQTYLGLQDYYNKNLNITATSSYNPSVNVYVWNTPVTSVDSNPEDIYAMQTALIMDNDYPPKGKTKNACPHSGTFGTCTRLAIQAFQKKNNIVGESFFGQKTFSLLNEIYYNK